MSVTDKDMGYMATLRQLIALQGAHVTVGVHGDSGAYPDGESVASVAMRHEFGSPEEGIPERSFLRSTTDDHEGDYMRMLGEGIDRAILGKGTVASELELIGVRVKGDVQQRITDIRWPPNSRATIEAKGSSNPLIDTGHMRQSIAYKIVLP